MINIFKSACIFLVMLPSIALPQKGEGALPSNIKWKYIQTGKLKVIFPEDTPADAQRVADILSYADTLQNRSLGTKRRKLNILIDPNTVLGNGYVAWAPFRSVLYPTPPSNALQLGSADFIDGLAIHEYRHVLQFSNMVFKPLYYITGETGVAAYNVISVPSWFFEGDAVQAETLLSEGGRGRLPAFKEITRAWLASGKRYSYMQACNGSYKDLVPNHYQLGYELVSHARINFGNEVWASVLQEMQHPKNFFYPFSGAFKRRTGIRTPQLYKNTLASMREKEQNLLKNRTLIPTTPVSSINKQTVTNYTYPRFLADGSILARKDSYSTVPALILLKNGIENKLIDIPANMVGALECNGDNVSWTELRNNPRRTARTYSVVVTYNLQTKKRTQITSKSRYFNPMPDSTGSRIVVANVSLSLKNAIHIIDVKTGTVISSLQNPTGDFVAQPKWAQAEKAIVYVAKRNSKMNIIRYNLQDNTQTELIPWTTQAIGSIFVGDNAVYFSAGYDGITNIYKTSLDGDLNIVRQTSVAIGADTPAISRDGSTLLIAEQTQWGKQISQVDISNTTSEELYNTSGKDEAVLQHNSMQANNAEKPIPDEIPQNNYNAKDYRGLFRGVQFHSFGLIFTDDLRTYKLGVQAGNILNDLAFMAAATYNTNEKGFGFVAEATYGKYFLPLHLQASTEDRNIPTSSGTNLKFQQTVLSADISAPLATYGGLYRTSIRPAATISYLKTAYPYSVYAKMLEFSSLNLSLKFANNRYMAKQNLMPKWSQFFKIAYDRSLSGDVNAERLSGNVGFTFIGLAKNHGLQTTISAKKEFSQTDYRYSDNFAHARGYAATTAPTEYVYSLDYALPIAYPDWGFAGLMYCKRLSAILFLDKGILQNNIVSLPQKSIGAELYADLQYFNIPVVPFRVGIRASHLLDQDPVRPNTKNYFEVLLAISF